MKRKITFVLVHTRPCNWCPTRLFYQAFYYSNGMAVDGVAKGIDVTISATGKDKIAVAKEVARRALGVSDVKCLRRLPGMPAEAYRIAPVFPTEVMHHV